MSLEILFGLVVFLCGVLVADMVKTKRERSDLAEQARRGADEAAERDKAEIVQEHDESRARTGSDWFSRWRKR